MPETSDEVSLKVEVADKASEALVALAGTIAKVMEAEKKMGDETRRLGRETEALERRKGEFEKQRKADAEAAGKRPTFGSALKETATAGRSLVSGGGLGSLMSLGGSFGMAGAAGLAMLDAGAKRAADAINIMQSTLLTKEQREQALIEEFVPLASSFRKLSEAVDGTTKRIAVSNQEKEVSIGVTRQSYGLSGRLREAEVPYMRAEAASRAFGVMGVDKMMDLPTFDRSTALGARKAQEQETTAPLADARMMANVRLIAAQTAKKQQDARYKNAKDMNDTSLEILGRDRERVQKVRDTTDISTGHGKAKYVEALNNFEAQKADQAETQARLEAERAKSEQAAADAARAESDYRKANIAVLKGELDLLRQKEERMAGFAAKLGGMNQADFEMAKESLRVVKETLESGQSLADLPAELVAQAGQAAPEFVAKQQEKLGAERAAEVGNEFKGVDDSILADFQKTTLAEVRAQVDKVRADVRVEVVMDEKMLADDITKSLGPLLRDFADSIKAVKAEIATDIRIAQAARAAEVR